MKILFISDEVIFGYGGGCIERQKYYDGLKEYALQQGDEFKVISLDEKKTETSFPVVVKKSRVKDVLARVMGHSTYMYFEWKKHSRKVYHYKPDVVFLTRSRMGFIERDLRRNMKHCRIICNFENIEYDYVNAYFANSSSILKKTYIVLEKWCTKRDEKMALDNADSVAFLTRRDLERAKLLYKYQCQHEIVLPICIEKDTVLMKNSEKKSVVFIGSLSYGSNLEALKMFLTEVWNPFFTNDSDLELIIGGSNPPQQLLKIIESIGNCKLHSNFSSLIDVVPIDSMVIAPIQHGAGMKVKVAETLSMGLMIAASDEALIGYEDAIEKDKLHGIVRANTADEYKLAIELFCGTSPEELKQISVQNKDIYLEHFSYEVSRKAIAALCDEIR